MRRTLMQQYSIATQLDTPPHATGVIRETETSRDWLEQWPVALSEPTAHAIIDHLLLIESELAQIRRLLLEEIGL
jgi:hypothetical protein